MINKILAMMLGAGMIATPVKQKTDVVIRAGEYENKPGKRIYVESDFQTPDDIPLRKDDKGYFISEWDINVKLAKKLADYLTIYGVKTDLQISQGKSEDLNSAGRIAKMKNPKIYLSIHHNYYKEDSTGYIYFVNPEDSKSRQYAEVLSNAISENPGKLPEWNVREQTTKYIGELNEKPGDINMLLEAGFFSNKDELEIIMSDEQIDYVAKETAQSLISVLYNEKTGGYN